MILGWICVALVATGANAQLQQPKCKSKPGSADWPSNSDWAQLNTTLGGVLLKPTPLAAACHKEFPEYNEDDCSYIRLRWNSSQFHSDHPTSALFQNTNLYSCLPDSKLPCRVEGFPVYVINATLVDHVKAAVNFVREKNVRLNIKSTGHDFIGKSVQPKSLSIWTHYLRTQEWFDKEYPLVGCNFTIPGPIVKAGAGSQMRELYRAAADRKLMIVGGASTTVSLGGYMSGGGHSSLSPYLGMGADNVVEIELVTANGDVIKANECTNPDLFWAMRGGGGSTFGVVTSFSIQAFPEVPMAQWSGRIGGNKSLDANWDAVTYIHQQWPKKLSPLGVSGHFIGNPNRGTIQVQINMPNATTNTSLPSILNPLLEEIRKFQDGSVTAAGIFTHYPAWGNWQFPKRPSWFRDDSASYSGNGVSKLITTWLWDSKALSSPDLKEVLKSTMDNDSSLWNLFTAGPGTHKGPIRGGSNAVNPAWRTAYVRATVAMQGPGWSLEKLKERKAALKRAGEILKRHAPGGGAYANEADPDMPDTIGSFYGVNYPRLLSIKQKMDPNGVFWCRTCVGSEFWEESSEGDLCRKAT